MANAVLPAKPPDKPSIIPIDIPLPIALFLIESPSSSNKSITFSSVNSKFFSFSLVSINSPKVNAASIDVAKPPKAPAKAPAGPAKAPAAAPVPAAAKVVLGASAKVPI